MNAKKPKIDLSGIPRVDPEPLRQKLKIFSNTKAEIASAKVRLEALKKEVNDFLETTSPDDQERLQIISAKRIQLEILPKMIARAERQIEVEFAPALLAEADKFRSALCRFYDDAHGVVATELANVFRPYISDRERNGRLIGAHQIAAEHSDDCIEIAVRKNEATWIRLPHASPRSNDPGSFDAVLRDGADALLALAEKA